MLTGIYKIKNTLTGDFYIGSTTEDEKRKGKHFWELRNNVHHNIHLQRAFNKYGEINFKFELIKPLNFPSNYTKSQIDKGLKIVEQAFVDYLNPHYNICREVERGRLGVKSSDITKERISKSNRGKKRTEEQKDYQSKIKLGKKHKNETKLKVSNYVNQAKGTRIGDKVTKEQIVLFANKFNNEFNIKTIKQICKENDLNYKSIIRFTQNQTFKELFYLLDTELLKDIKNPSKNKIKSQNGL